MENFDQQQPGVSENNGNQVLTIAGRNGGTLRPFVKGQSGNPSGMRKGTLQFRTILERVLAENIPVVINGQQFTMSRADAIVYELVRMATNTGTSDMVKLRAIAELIDRIDGKPTPVLPDTGNEAERPDTVIFYIPNEHSRFKSG